MAIDSRKLDAVFTETIRKANKGAISAIIFNEDSILYEAHDGWIDKKNRRKPADDSLYMIGSNTKVMTTLGLMRLWEDGKLDPQDDIRRYIPEFSVKAGWGTIRLRLRIS
jgi:D-alanyl-D-alanine carboxypeptidase